MSVDFIVSSLPELKFSEKPAIDADKFAAMVGELPENPAWKDLETQLRNAIAEARATAGYERALRPAVGCSIFWKNRILACFQEKDVLKRDEMIDRVFWDAAGELTPPAEPLGKGALQTYAIRLKIALKRAKISTDEGNAAFDRLTAATKIEF